VEVMTANDYSQIPITNGGRFIGSVNETRLYQAIVKDPEVKTRPIENHHAARVPVADISMTLDALATMITPESPAVLVRDFKAQDTYIITRWDVIRALG
jgi:predicted transcriptional regulator